MMQARVKNLKHQEGRRETLVTMEEWIKVIKCNESIPQKITEKSIVAMD